MNSNTVNSQSEQKSWEVDYNKLLAFQKERGIHPVHDHNPDIMKKIVQDFLSAFCQISEQDVALRKRIATAPLFSQEIQFREDFEESIETARPLNYIMFTAHKKALDILSPYLKKEDWLRPGPYGSTFVHCVISGIENNCSSSGEPTACVEELVKRYPDLKTKPNMFGTSPLSYLKDVMPKLQRNYDYINSQGGGGYGGMNKMIRTSDNCGTCYNETINQYEILIEEAKKIERILVDSKQFIRI